MVIKEGYKLTELGIIPSDWQVKTLGEILHSNQLGGNYPNNENLSEYPLIKMGNINRGSININKIQFINNGIIPFENDLLKYGDVLFNTRNTLDLVGKVAVWRNELQTAYFNSNIMRLVFNEKFISSNFYMNLILNTRNSLFQLKGIATGTTSVAAIYTRDLIKITIPIPTLAEQTAIATALSDADGLITGLEKLIAKKRNIKQGAMQQLLQPKEGWMNNEIGNVFQFRQGVQCAIEKQSTEDSIGLKRFIRIVDLSQTKEIPRYINDPGLSHHIKKTDLFMVRYGNPGLLGYGYDGVIANNLFRLIPKIRIESNFFYYLLYSKNEDILQLSSSTTMAALNFTSLKILKLDYPKSLSEQTRIATILSDMDAELSALEQKLEKYKKVKLGMMQELLTGKTRLN